MQTAYAFTYYFIYPSVASLLGRTIVIFACVLSFLLFHDERGVLASWRFRAGTALAFLGVVAVILGQDPAMLSRLHVTGASFRVGVALAILCAFFSALYLVAIKHLVRDVGPFAAFTNVSWMTALALVVLMFAVGRPRALVTQPVLPALVMVVSAFLCIVVAHTSYYAALRSIKVVVTVSLLNLTPVFTSTISAVVYHDRLSWFQILGGAAVLAGAWLAALAHTRVEADEPPDMAARAL